MAQVPNNNEVQLTNAAPQKPSYNRDEILVEYEAELKKARKWARIIAVLHTFSQFLAFCNLTWATVALLGAFLPDLAPSDFGFVASLLFIEAGRLASASFFLRFLMRPLVYGSQDPKRITHGDDAQYPASLRLRRSSHFVQCLLIAPGFVLPIIAHIRLQSYSEILNLNSSLRIFYSFVAFNSLVGFISLVCSIQAFRVLSSKPTEQSILRYFDTVLERAISSGDLLRADVFEFFSFAYTMLAADFRRQMQPKSVAQNHKKLIQYLNAHRLGPDALKIHLEAEDPFVQLVAVNMVGFWLDRVWGVGVPEAEWTPSEELLTKLADKVGTGQLGWAAATIFGVMAGTQKGVLLMARTHTSNNIGLLDRLANIVDDSSNRSLSLVRALVNTYEQHCVNKQEPPELCKQESELVGKLGKLAREGGVHRLRVIAAYLLLLMDKRSAYNNEVILAIDLSQDSYWYRSEIEMLELLRSHIPDAPPLQIPEFAKPDPKKPDKPKRFTIKEDAKITAPPWARAVL